MLFNEKKETLSFSDIKIGSIIILSETMISGLESYIGKVGYVQSITDSFNIIIYFPQTNLKRTFSKVLFKESTLRYTWIIHSY